MRRRFTGNEVTEVIRLYTQERQTLQRIADRYGCDQSTVWRLLRREGRAAAETGRSPRSPARGSAAPWLAEAIAVYTAGGTLQEAANAVGVKCQKVYYQFKKAGIPRRRAGRPRKAVLEGLRRLWQQATREERQTFLEEVGREGQ
jgi:transposase-like protein